MKCEQLENNNYMMMMAMTDDDEVGDDWAFTTGNLNVVVNLNSNLVYYSV